MQFSKKVTVIEAHQWFKNGDHPEDGPGNTEGKIVRYFRSPDISGSEICKDCANSIHEHGWIDSLAPPSGYKVCPGDWIVAEIDLDYPLIETFWYYPCKSSIFNRIYRKISQKLPD